MTNSNGEAITVARGQVVYACADRNPDERAAAMNTLRPVEVMARGFAIRLEYS